MWWKMNSSEKKMSLEGLTKTPADIVIPKPAL